MYKKGNVFQEQERNGWIYGNFMPDGDMSKDDRVEIKVAKLDNSFTSKQHYNKTSTKIDIIWSGKAIWEIEGKDVKMNSGDYLIIPPKTVVCVKKVISDELIVQTIRFPSIPDDKVMVQKS
jgi:mannose-6-phosphate isomerase-like protein (cupin superfamily)